MGVGEREAQQFGMMLGVMVVFSFLLRNVWLTLFMCWTVFLYSFFKFQLGNIYLSNIFYGCIIYYLTKLVFEKKHINFFINALLWLVCVNILYMCLQVSNFDFIYKYVVNQTQVHFWNTKPAGFMGNSGYMGCLMAFGIPLLASRSGKWALIGSIGLFVPLYLSRSSLCMLAGVIGLLFVLFFKMPRKFWVGILIMLLLGSGFYSQKIDKQNFYNSSRIQHWKTVLRFSITHPITGWGLDSYRNMTKEKKFVFYNEKWGNRQADLVQYWDNPHNLYISLFFEFGFIGLFLFGGYLRQCAIRFNRSIKEPNCLALGGFLLLFLVLSMGHFPLFLARCACFIISAVSLFEVQTHA